MSNLELSLLIGLWPILYFLTYTAMHQNLCPRQRIVTTVLQRRGEVIAVGLTHSLIEFDGGYTELCRNSLFTEEF